MRLLPSLALAATLTTPSMASTATVLPASANITRQMAVQRADRLFALLDTDHEGILTRGEARDAGVKLMAERIVSGRDVAPGIGGHTLKFFERTFAASRDVDKRQFEQAMLAHFDEMDRNHDGVLTPAERQAGRSLADDR